MSKKVFWTPTLHGITIPLPVRKELRVRQHQERISPTQQRSHSLCCLTETLQNKPQTRTSKPSLLLISLRKTRTSLPKNLLVKIQTTNTTQHLQQLTKQQLHNLLQIRKLRGSPTAADAPGIPYSWSSLQVRYSGGPHTRNQKQHLTSGEGRFWCNIFLENSKFTDIFLFLAIKDVKQA